MSKKKGDKKKPLPATDKQQSPTEALYVLADKRTGGAVNIAGITFQTLYAVNILLREFGKGNSVTVIRLEGLEDLDLDKSKVTVGDVELVQLKTSINSINASDFWGMNVLKNFLEVYINEPAFNYRFVYNMNIAAGKLDELINKKAKSGYLPHWQQKLESLSICPSALDAETFLNKIVYEKTTAEELFKKAVSLFLSNVAVNPGTELQYLKSLFYHALEWSKQRVPVNQLMFDQAIREVTDAFSKGTVNAAVTNNWITEVNFDPTAKNSADDYFEGKAARPEHIVQQIPVPRPYWEKHIKGQLEKTDIVVIKSSSGQGKSTLAWQIAWKMHQEKKPVYQLHHCQLAEYTGPIIDFIKSRVIIGQYPLIILDGLNQQHQHWSAVVAGTADLPVKYLLTTREEDWFNYSSDISRLNMQITDICLDAGEAKNIYLHLKQNKKIHPEIINWQTPWEKLATKGLLIEYAFLLTKGQMIAERLDAQIKRLNVGEQDGAAKTEILRLIALSDILGLRLKSDILITHVKNTVGISGDRSELFRQLENEYFIKLDSQYVEGLHPVRSKHLTELLHKFVQISDTILELLNILEPAYYFAAAAGIMEFIPENDRQTFLEKVARFIAKKDLIDMVAIIEGIMVREPQRYWTVNRQIFDEVFEEGGIEIFTMDTLPFTKLKMLDFLEETFSSEFQGPSVLREKATRLKKFDFQESGAAAFIRLLAACIDPARLRDFKGLASLLKWLNKVKPTANLEITITEDDLLKSAYEDTNEVSAELFYYFQHKHPNRFQVFFDTHKQDILSSLKKQTDSVTIVERDEDLFITYVIDNESADANAQSVKRIEQCHALLPGYKVYHTEVIYLPFPNDAIYHVIRIDGGKHLAAENLFDPFEAQINRAWSDNLLRNYDAPSVYDWQRELVSLFKIALEFIKRTSQFFEFLIENNDERRKKAVNPLIEMSDEVYKALRIRRRFPDQADREKDKLFKKRLEGINEWGQSLKNFMNQMSKIMLRDTDGSHIAMINMRKTVFQLPVAYKLYRDLAAESTMYFDISKLEAEGLVWYDRFRATIEYFQYFPESHPISAKNTVAEWWNKYKRERLKSLSSGLQIISESSGYIFYPPNALEEDEYGVDAVIGIEGISADPNQSEQEILPLLMHLVPLLALEFVTYDLVFLQGKLATGAIRVQKTFLEKLQLMIETGEFQESEIGNPIPISLEAEQLLLLDNVEQPDMQTFNVNQSFGKIVYSLWRFQQYREKLNVTNILEKNWLIALKQDCEQFVEALFVEMTARMDSDQDFLYTLFETVILKEINLETEAYVNVMMKKALEINNAITGFRNN